MEHRDTCISAFSISFNYHFGKILAYAMKGFKDIGPDMERERSDEVRRIPEELGLRDELDQLRKEGDRAFETGDWDTALLKFKAMSALGLSLNIKEALAEGYRKSGHVERLRGNYRKAERLYQKGLDVSRAIADAAGIADTFRGLCYIFSRRAELGQALVHGMQALEQARVVGDPELTGRILIDIGNVHNAAYRLDEAMAKYEEALGVLPESSFFQRGRALNNIGEVHKRRGDYDAAIESLGKVISEGVTTGDINNRAWALFSSAECHARKGDMGRAEEYIELSSELLERSQDEVGMQELYKVRGILHRLKWEPEAAKKDFERSILLGKRLDLPADTASAYVEYGRLLKDAGDDEGAVACLRQAAALFSTAGLEREEVEARSLLASFEGK